MNGYETLIRQNGSKFYLCDTCEKEGFGSNSEETIIIHVVTHHTDEAEN